MRDEAATREHVQRRTEHHESRGRVDQVEGGLDAIVRHTLAEVDDIRLQGPAAHRAGHHDEGVEMRLRNIDVAVRVDGGHRRPPSRIRDGDAGVHGVAVLDRSAVQADDPIESTMQVDHRRTTGSLMQTVDVLRDDAGDHPATLEFGHGVVPGVGTGAGELMPAQEPARPVPAPGDRVARERLERHRGALAQRRTARPSIVRDPTLRGDPRPREDGHIPHHEECAEFVEFGDHHPIVPDAERGNARVASRRCARPAVR